MRLDKVNSEADSQSFVHLVTHNESPYIHMKDETFNCSYYEMTFCLFVEGISEVYRSDTKTNAQMV